MAPWEKYQHQKNKIPPQTRELWKVKEKIQNIHRKDSFSKKIYSSVSLPKFVIYRMRSSIQKKYLFGEKQHRKISESQVIIVCLVLLLRKLRNRRISNIGPRCKLYNDDKYSYGKVSVYADRNLWQALHSRAIELEVSLSLLSDIAIRLFLSYVINLWLRKEQKVKAAKLLWTNFSQLFSYQKTFENRYAKNKNEQGIFRLSIKFAFGTKHDPPLKSPT